MRCLAALLIAILIWCGAARAASPTIATGSATNRAGSGGSSLAVTVTTIPANSVVFFAVYTLCATGAAATATSVTSPDLTWVRLTGSSQTATNATNMELWWAPSSGSIASETITVNLSRSITLGMEVYGFAVSGAYNINSPFDRNPAATQANNNVTGGGGSGPTLTQSTSQPDDLLLFVNGTNASGSGGAPTGFSLIQSNGSAVASSSSSVSSKSLSATTTGATYSGPASGTTGTSIITAVTADLIGLQGPGVGLFQ